MADNGKLYQIFRYDKVKSSGAIRWREIEQNRTQADKDRDFNGDIDFERTQNNVYLVHGRDLDLSQYLGHKKLNFFPLPKSKEKCFLSC